MRSPAQRIQDEVDSRTSCPYCDGRRVLPGYNSFAALLSDLIEEWDHVNNYPLADPDEISDTDLESVAGGTITEGAKGFRASAGDEVDYSLFAATAI